MSDMPADQLYVFGFSSLTVGASPNGRIITTFSGPDTLSRNDLGLRVALDLSPAEALSLAQSLEHKAHAALAGSAQPPEEGIQAPPPSST